MKNLLAFPLFMLIILSGCNPGKDKSKESSITIIPENSFDVNKPDTWPVKFSDFGFTPLSYANAESYAFMQNFINRNGINNIFHFKTLSKAEDHWVVSPNNDVLYSMVTVDCSDDFSLIIPETKDNRYVSYQIVDGDHFTPVHGYGAGTYDFPKGTFNTPFVAIGIRVVVDPTDEQDINYVATEVQPGMKIIAKSSKNKVPDFDKEKMEDLRKTLMPYYDDLANTFGGMTKNASEVTDLWFRMLCTAGAWGLSEDEHAMYIPYAPKLKTDKAYRATYSVPKQDEFWSITMYNENKYLVSNDHNTINKYNVVLNEDGTFTVCFGSAEQCGNAKNRLDVSDNWNFLMRAYKPDVEAFKNYKMPKVEPVN